MVLYASLLDGTPVNTGGGPVDPGPVIPGPSGGQDPNPVPIPTAIRYASPTGSGVGLTPTDPMSYTAGLNWIDDTAGAGGTLNLLPGTYTISSTYWFNNSRNLGVNSKYRVIRSHDLNNQALLLGSAASYGILGFKDGANRICVYGVKANGQCGTTAPPAPPNYDGANYFIQLGDDQTVRPGKDCHHIWIKGCTAWNFYTGAIGSVGADHIDLLPANVNEMFLVEDNVFYETAHGAPWGGSACSIFFPQQSLTDGQIDNMFKPTIEGVQVICGFIFRRNIGYRNYQAREDTASNSYTDGNFLTTDFWNGADYAGHGVNDYNRAALIENNISFGNGRFYASTITHPSGGVYLRFNTSVYDGITYRHSFFGVSTAADHLGGFGGWNDSFRIHANLFVYDPNMNHPNGVGTHKFSGDGVFSGPASVPLSSAWNLAKVNASATLGPAFAGATNTITSDPGLGTPPDYLAHNGEIPRTTIKAWATPSSSSQAKQANQPYRPSDGVDCFWRPRTTGSIGACLPGGT